jgi:hypothetical protein
VKLRSWPTSDGLSVGLFDITAASPGLDLELRERTVKQ